MNHVKPELLSIYQGVCLQHVDRFSLLGYNYSRDLAVGGHRIQLSSWFRKDSPIVSDKEIDMRAQHVQRSACSTQLEVCTATRIRG